ncbi:MAG: SLC13 family permease [Pseudomonadota bacterium]
MPEFHALFALALTAAVFVAFARGRMAIEIVSLLAIAAIALALYFVPMEGGKAYDGLALAFSGFGHPALITICALMIMGRGLVVTGSLDPLVRLLEGIWRIDQRIGLLVTLLLAFFLSMVINDTPVLVLLLPVLLQLSTRGGLAASRTLIPVNAAVLIGGMSTTIGTSTNLLVVSIAGDLGLPPMSIFHFTPLVLVAALVALPYLWLVMPRLLADDRPPEVATARKFETTMRIASGSDLIGLTVGEAAKKLPDGVELLANPGALIAPRDQLLASGTHDALAEAARRFGAAIAPVWLLDQVSTDAARTRADLVVAELAITADSRLVGLTLPTSGVADLYGIAILGVHRASRRETAIDHSVGQQTLGEGDVLLTMGTMEQIREFAQGDALLVLDGAREMPRRAKAILALAIMFGSVATASLGLLPIAISALGGAIAMLVTGCVRFDRVGRALSAKVIVLVAASIAIGRLVLESGAAAFLADVLSLGLVYLPAAGVMAAVMIFVAALTNFASNATAATVGTPIAVSIAGQLGLPPEPLVLAVLFGCNLCYATPVAYQTNMLIMAEGGYQFRDYVRTGLPLILIMVVSLSILLTLRYGL